MRKITLMFFAFVAFCWQSNAQLNEGFDSAGLPTGWVETIISGADNDWAFGATSNQNSTVSPRTGAGMAYYYEGSYSGETNRLETPSQDLTTFTTPILTFYYTQVDWGGDQDELSIWYKDSAAGTWTMISEYTGSVSEWTKVEIVLPSPSADYYIGFQGFSGYGRGITLDDVSVSEAPSCVEPTALAVSDETTSSAIVSWTAGGSETLWNIEVVDITGGGSVTGTATESGVTNPYTLTGLAAGNDYTFYVQADCDGGDLSAWAGPFAFTTLCTSIASFPWAEDFEGISTPDLPTCWDESNNNADGDFWRTYSGFGVSGSNAAGLNTDFNSGSNDDYLILPQFTLTGNERLKYNVRARSSFEPNDYKVVLSTTGSAPADFTTDLLGLTEVSNTTHEEQVINLSAYTGDVYIAIHVPAGGLDGYYIYFDNFTVEELPSCLEPSDLTVTSFTENSADLSWTAGDSETLWNIEVVDITAGGTATGTATETGVTNPYTVSGLVADNFYEFYLQADCGGSVSAWVGPVTVYTGYCIPASTSASTYTNTFALTGGLTETLTTETGYSGTGYADYYDTNAIESFEGGSFNFSATIVGGTAGYAIWVDWNNDFVFDPATETVYNTLSYGSGPFTGTITVPSGTALGDYRLRTMVDWSDSNPNDDACAFAATRGEVEDYKITIVEAPTDTLDFNNVQWVTDGTNGSDSSLTVEANTAVTVYAQAYEAGLTEPEGAGAGIECWIAINNENTDPATWDGGLWQVATYGGDVGNNDEYVYTTSSVAPGTNYVAARWRLNNASFTYGGFNGTWDGTTNVSIELIVNPIVNDNCSGAISLTPGSVFEDNALVGTNLGATDSGELPLPGCALYDPADVTGFGGDVWYSVTVPADGNLTIQLNANPTGSGGDSGMAVYSGECGSLALVECDDDDSPDGAYSQVVLEPVDGLENQVVYVRVWEYGGNSEMNFQISAYNCSADAGTLTADQSVVELSGGTATISATSNGDTVVPANYEVTYVLTSGTDLVIEAAGATPSFEVNAAGDYTIHTLVAETSDNTNASFLDLSVIVFGTTTGADVLGLLSGICADLDVTGAPITVLEECLADAGTLTADAATVELTGGIATISATPNGDIVVPANYEVTYVLTSGTALVIENAGASPSFEVNAVGDYTIHTLVAETSDNTDPNYLDLSVINFGTTTAADVLALIGTSGITCVALDVTGAPITVEDNLSVGNLEDESSFSYFPNPVKNTLKLKAQNTIEQVSIYNMLGQEVLRATPNNVDSTIDMSSLQSGAYFVKVTIQNVTKTVRVMKH